MKTISKKIIIKKALELFKQKGYKNVTVDEICMACDITKPTFYNYVPAKEELILDVYDDIISHLFDDMAEIIKIDSPYEQLTFIFARLIKGTADFGADLVSQLFVANFKEDRHSFDLRDQLTELALSLIEKAQQTKEIQNPARAEDLYLSLGHMFTGYSVMWCISQGKTNLREKFFSSMNTLFIPQDHLMACYKKYS